MKAERPDAWITVAAAGVTANTLTASPDIDELIVTPHPMKDIAGAALAVL